ncbi:hypothetical protein SAMN05192533_102297 [Mesobacillus persicus]|uniref:Sigma-70, region 4 n=1 Tax=Mesobacillus persicus TaxID=930146 RepID=A0A1H7XNU3_9BACI|nr:hypothetical protein [Mesobacillus persicus]SEM35476.1 hypothetical protein SAMN05192533_102297 [Mesobacillus persicus]
MEFLYTSNEVAETLEHWQSIDEWALIDCHIPKWDIESVIPMLSSEEQLFLHHWIQDHLTEELAQMYKMTEDGIRKKKKRVSEKISKLLNEE